jgi:dCMP deaminase
MDRQEKWDLRFLKLAEEVASYSKDPSTKVGAVIVEPDTNIIISVGYNGFPRGVEDHDYRLNNRELKYEMVVHAEVNAILHAGHRARGGRMYVWPSFMLPPICSRCCTTAIQAGIKEIVGYIIDEGNLDERQLRWRHSILLSREMCDESGVNYYGVKI